MKWLITGGGGFIGSNLIGALLSGGEETIRVLDNCSVGTPETLWRLARVAEVAPEQVVPMRDGDGQEVELVIADIGDANLALKASAGADVIVHLAANTGVQLSVDDPRGDMQTNVEGTLNYLEAARHNKIRKFILASSNAPLGAAEQPVNEQSPARPMSPYGASKLAGEAYCSAYFHAFGVAAVALRFGNVYGPGSTHKSSVVAKFIRQALSGEGWEFYGDGTQTRDFIHIDDLVASLLAAARAEGVGGETFQIANQTETSIAALAETLAEALSRNGIDIAPPAQGPTRPGDMDRNFADISKAKTRLGWSPQVTLDDGLKRTVEWFLAADHG